MGTRWIAVLLLAVTVGVYAPVAGHEFLNYDDPDYVTENPNVTAGLTLGGVVWAFTHVHQATWHPLTSLSHMLDCSLFGLDPAGPHLHNLALHVANSLLTFAVLLRLTGDVGPSTFVAALFALHPLHVESVAWVSERKDVLSTLFWLLTMWAYAAYAERKSGGRYLLALLTFVLGLLAKPMLVTLPFVLLLLDYWPMNRMQTPRDLWVLVREKLPFFALAGALSVVTYLVQVQAGAVATLESVPLDLRIENALVSYVSYLGQIFVPAGLVVFYPFPASIPAWQVLSACTILLGVTVLALRSAKERPYLIVGWFWYLGTLVPVLGIVKQGDQAMADRFTYVPAIGIFVMVAWAAAPLVERTRGGTIAGLAAASLVLGILAVRTSAQVAVWRSSATLFSHALTVNPDNYIAHLNLGSVLHEKGEAQAATLHFEKALALRPNNPKALLDVGMMLGERGDTEGAVVQYRRAIAADPTYASAHFDLGMELAKQGAFDEAAASLENALRLAPDHVKAHIQLGLVRAEQGRQEDAIAQYRAALTLAPASIPARGNLALALERVGRPTEAIQEYRELLRMRPNDALAHFNLGAALAGQGDKVAALAAYREALRHRADWPDAQSRIAGLLITGADGDDAGRRAEALTLAERACVQSKFEDPTLLRTLAATYASLGRASEAVQTAKKALARAQAFGDASLVDALRLDLERYSAPADITNPR